MTSLTSNDVVYAVLHEYRRASEEQVRGILAAAQAFLALRAGARVKFVLWEGGRPLQPLKLWQVRAGMRIIETLYEPEPHSPFLTVTLERGSVETDL